MCSDEEKKTLENVIKRMVLPDRSQRLNLADAYKIVEKIIFERTIKALPRETQVKMRIVQFHAINIRDYLEGLDGCTLDSLVNDDFFERISNTVPSLLKQTLMSNDHIDQLINTLGVNHFIGCTTLDELKNSAKKLFKDFESNYEQLNELKKDLTELTNALIECDLLKDQLNDLDKITQPINIILDRAKTMQLTLDNLALYNIKCKIAIETAFKTLVAYKLKVMPQIEKRKALIEQERIRRDDEPSIAPPVQKQDKFGLFTTNLPVDNTPFSSSSDILGHQLRKSHK